MTFTKTLKPAQMLLPLLTLSSGILLVWYGLSGYINGDVLRDIDYWWIACLGLAAIAFSVFGAIGWILSGAMAALFIAGFSAQLGLKDPFWFQQFRFSEADLAVPMLGTIALQGLAGGLYLLRAGALRQVMRMGRGLGWLRLLIMSAVLIAASKAAMEFIATEDMPRYAKQLTIALGFLACNVVVLSAFLVALPNDALKRAGEWLSGLVAASSNAGIASRLDARLPWILAAFVFAVCFSISLWSFDGVPHLDGLVYLFHARYFADGVLTLPIPPSLEAFDSYLMDTRDGRWFSVNLPGWPAALSLGVMIDAPWLINPLLAGMSVLLLHRFIRIETDRRTADLVTLLLAISPWYLSMSSTMLIHTFAYAMILGAWVLLQVSRRSPGLVFPFMAGCLMGWLFLARPLEGVYMGVLTGLWTLTFLRNRHQWKTVIMYSAGCLAVGIWLFIYNRALTGSATLMPINAYLDRFWGPGKNDIGFGANRGAPDWGNVDVLDGHSPIEAMINFQQNLYELNMDLFGWGAASLFFALIFMLWGRWTKFAAGMAAIVVVTILLYSLYWYSGGFYAGPRYWFPVLVPMLVFTAFGLQRFAELLSRIFPGRHMGVRTAVLATLLDSTSVLVFESWMALIKYPDINGYHADYLHLSRSDELQNAVVFIRSENLDNAYGSAFWLNDFAPDAETPLFARDLGFASNREIAAAYPERNIYFVEGRSSDNPMAKPVEGPLSIEDLSQSGPGG